MVTADVLATGQFSSGPWKIAIDPGDSAILALLIAIMWKAPKNARHYALRRASRCSADSCMS